MVRRAFRVAPRIGLGEDEIRLGRMSFVQSRMGPRGHFWSEIPHEKAKSTLNMRDVRSSSLTYNGKPTSHLRWLPPCRLIYNRKPPTQTAATNPRQMRIVDLEYALDFFAKNFGPKWSDEPTTWIRAVGTRQRRYFLCEVECAKARNRTDSTYLA